MDPILYELLTTIVAGIFFAALAYLRTNYADLFPQPEMPIGGEIE